MSGTVSIKREYGPFGELLRASGPMAKANPFIKGSDDESSELPVRYYRVITQ